jgi:hypothetical protein
MVAGVMLACTDNPLDVDNLNSPDVTRSYATPSNVETLGSSVLKNMFNGQYNALESIWPQTMTMSFESHSQLGNAAMGTRAALPRSPIDNTIGNSAAPGNFRDFDALSRNMRTAANVAAAIDRYRSETPPRSAGGVERDRRNKAFALFNVAYALGHLSMIYDSAVIVTHLTPSDEIPPFSGAADVNKAALSMMDSAIAYANQATGQTIPFDWISDNGSANMSMARFIQVMRSFKARFRAGVARSKTDRETKVDWNQVIADATNGIQSDFIVAANATTGWGVGTIGTLRQASSWSQMTPMILGMGDTSRVGDPLGSYRDWIKAPIGQRNNFIFLMRTPDRRFPAGNTRAAQITASGNTSKAGPPTATPWLYFRNRPIGEDNVAEPWGTWYYDNHRFWGIPNNSNNGPFVVLSRAENDMLAAEGYLRTGKFAEATALIDRYRVLNGLLPVTGITDLTTPVPGGPLSCVPNVPVGPSFTTTACGNLMEAMKWEKRVETSFTGYAQWFIDNRGWGDMAEGTALEWPVPYDELFARQILTTYTTTLRAPKGTYGF